MAKKSSIEKNERRKRMTLQHAAKRKAFKAVMKDPKSTDAQKLAAQTGLQKLPRNSAPERVRNRCSMTGRARGYVATFGL
ncbi:MAG TPA: 30S ribosomal protein S14, partial [Gemmatimonadaceae bacterium]